MKITLALTALMISLSSFAGAFNEVECKITVDNKEIRVEVEQPFPQGSYFKRATLFVTEVGNEQEHDYTVSTRRSRGFNDIEYSGAGLRLRVDFWPDQNPRWGRTYKGTLLSSALGNQYIQWLDCTFPFAN